MYEKVIGGIKTKKVELQRPNDKNMEAAKEWDDDDENLN